jgi:hypothetical protein
VIISLIIIIRVRNGRLRFWAVFGLLAFVLVASVGVCLVPRLLRIVISARGCLLGFDIMAYRLKMQDITQLGGVIMKSQSADLPITAMILREKEELV